MNFELNSLIFARQKTGHLSIPCAGEIAGNVAVLA
jgi:hypothetical protein